MLRVVLGVLVLTLALAAPVAGATWVVPTEVPNLRQALATCSNGDTVLVEDGTYAGPDNRNLMAPQLDLVMRSRGGAALCTIDCQWQGEWLHVLDAEQPHELLIEGFRVVHASSSAVYQVYGAVAIRDCEFEGNFGALYATGPSTLVDGCSFRNNDVGVPGQGGAVWVGLGEATFVDCVFEHNRSGWGGAIHGGVTGTLRLENCTIAGNEAAYEGGGIYFGSGSLILRRTIVWGNHSELHHHADEIFALNQGPEPECCDLRREGIYGTSWTYQSCIDADPRFCDTAGWDHPEYPSDYRLRSDSPCLPWFTPCGALIGALDAGCTAPRPVGACCVGLDCSLLTEQECLAAQGNYQGDDAGCFPLPCAPVPVQEVTWGRIKSLYRR